MNLTRHKLNIMAPDGASWSGLWRKAKRAYYKKHEKKCAVCSGKKAVQLHHKKPRHLFPKLALDEDNCNFFAAAIKVNSGDATPCGPKARSVVVISPLCANIEYEDIPVTLPNLTSAP